MPLTSAQSMLNITKYDQLTALLAKQHLTLDADASMTVGELMQQSDNALYEARAGGRNRVIVGSDSHAGATAIARLS